MFKLISKYHPVYFYSNIIFNRTVDHGSDITSLRSSRRGYTPEPPTIKKANLKKTKITTRRGSGRPKLASVRQMIFIKKTFEFFNIFVFWWVFCISTCRLEKEKLEKVASLWHQLNSQDSQFNSPPVEKKRLQIQNNTSILSPQLHSKLIQDYSYPEAGDITVKRRHKAGAKSSSFKDTIEMKSSNSMSSSLKGNLKVSFFPVSPQVSNKKIYFSGPTSKSYRSKHTVHHNNG